MRLDDRKALNYSGIYKITNKLTQHSYIGQARNINLRIYQHLISVKNASKSDYLYPLHQAIRKYGRDNFELDVLEKCSEELLDEREIYYISRYHTCKLDSVWAGGYNLTFGGKQGIRRIKLTRLDVLAIYELLASTALPMVEIALKYNVCKDTIYGINDGSIWHCNDRSYPIRSRKDCLTTRYEFDGTCIAKLDFKTKEIICRYPSRNAAAIALGNKSYAPHIGEVLRGCRKSAYGFAWKREAISVENWLLLLKEFNEQFDIG